MKRKYRIWMLALSSLLLLCSSCSKGERESKKPPWKETGKEEMLMDQISSVDSSRNDALEKSYEEKRRTGKPTDFYNLSVETVEASSLFTYRKLSVPEKIQDHSFSCIAIYDDSTLLVFLYKEIGVGGKRKEVGLYNFESGEYRSLFTIPEEVYSGFCALSRDYLIFALSQDNWMTGALHCYSFADGSFREVYQYLVDPQTRSMRSVFQDNNILILGDVLWFDDNRRTAEGDIAVEMYNLNLKTLELKKVREHAQNPMLYKDKIYYFVRNEKGEYFRIRAHDDSEQIEIAEYLIDIAACKDELHCIENVYTDREHVFLFHQVKDLIRKKPILSTVRSIDTLRVSEHFVTWFNHDAHIPCFYDIRSGKLALFSDLPGGHNKFLLKDDYSILVNSLGGVRNVYLIEPIR